MRKRILLIDDEKMFAVLLKRVLEDQGYEVRALYSGDTTVDELWERRFDLLLMDINIANLDGRDIAKRVRFVYKKTPIVLMSGLIKVEEIEDGLADRFLQKPFPLEVLVATVRELIGGPEVDRPDSSEGGTSMGGSSAGAGNQTT
jgi:DNA-binding response OmpR family regulator